MGNKFSYHSSTEETTKIGGSAPSQLLVWCSQRNNRITVVDIAAKTKYISFDGAPTKPGTKFVWTYVKEVPDTKLLISLQHSSEFSASMEIFSISQKGQARKIYSFEGVLGNEFPFIFLAMNLAHQFRLIN